MQIISKVLYYSRSIFSILSGFQNPIYLGSTFLGFQRDKAKEKLVKLRKNDVFFYVRNVMDIWSIKETFIDDFYHFENSSKPRTGVIIDIGAGIGEFTIQSAKACPDCRVYGFEPFTESFDYLVKNSELNSLKNIFPVAAAVSSLPGTMVLDTTSGNPLQFRMKVGTPTESSIKTVLLMDFLNEQSIDDVELIKLDCEGGEFDILLPLSKEDLIRLKRIVMEYHDSLTTHNHSELVRHLVNAGFTVETVANIVYDDIGYIYAQL
jgi:FkbM family methyltransferase